MAVNDAAAGAPHSSDKQRTKAGVAQYCTKNSI
jgi:hypothetical protein